MSFNRTSFEGLQDALPTADCIVLVNAFVMVVAFEAVTFSFSEQRVLLDRHVPILTMFFLRVKLAVIGGALLTLEHSSPPIHCYFFCCSTAAGLFI